MIELSANDLARYLSKVGRGDPEECWLWQGSKVSGGYGVIGIEGRNQSAHRIAWQIEHGKIRKGKQVRHTCPNRDCVNPSHLYLSTVAQRMKDVSKRGLNSGENNKASKLTKEQVITIRKRAAGGERQAALAREYDVSRNLIHLIVHRKMWAHV